jgi:type IV secretory pathway VirB10-like protein
MNMKRTFLLPPVIGTVLFLFGASAQAADDNKKPAVVGCSGIVVTLEDGTRVDSCAPIRPSTPVQASKVAPVQAPLAPPPVQAPPAPPPVTQPAPVPQPAEKPAAPTPTANTMTKKSARQLTQEEMQNAYRMSLARIATMLKAPATAQYQPIEQVQFSPGKLQKNGIVVRLYVDAQNSFGAMLRQLWTCHVGSQQPNGLYKVFCNAGMF